MAIPTDAVALNNQTVLARNTNQALGIGHFAIDFMSGKIGNPDASVLERTTMFHTDSVLCGISAIALNTNAPIILRKEAAEYPNAKGATVFGSTAKVAAEKAIVANSNAVREWDSNGTNFGYNPTLGHTAGEFGHNDFYPVAIAAAQQQGRDGAYALRGMVCIDEIRGRGDMAFVSGHSTIVPVGGGPPVELARYLDVRLRQADGSWIFYRDMVTPVPRPTESR